MLEFFHFILLSNFHATIKEENVRKTSLGSFRICEENNEHPGIYNKVFLETDDNKQLIFVGKDWELLDRVYKTHSSLPEEERYKCKEDVKKLLVYVVEKDRKMFKDIKYIGINVYGCIKFLKKYL